MRSWNASFKQVLEAAKLKPVVLVTVDTGLASPNDIIRICNAERPIAFPDGGDVYTPRPFEVGEIPVVTHDESTGTTMQLGDADGFWRALVNAGMDLEDRRIEVRIVERSQLDGSAKRTLDKFVVDGSPDEAGDVMQVQLKPLDSFQDEIFPRGIMDRVFFPGLPERR